MMNHRLGQGSKAFTLTEVILATLVVGMITLSVARTQFVVRAQDAKNRDRGIITDFAAHYLECVRGIPFAQLKPGMAVNALFDGTGGAPRILIPLVGTWTTIDTADFQQFHPELIWFTNRSLAMNVAVSTNLTPAGTVTKLIDLKLRWRPSLNAGSTQYFRASLLRVPDA